MEKLKLALLAGGISSEREVSLNSGAQVYDALDKAKYDIRRYDPRTDLSRLVADAADLDAALIILHGPFGEDGTIQGLLELLDIPYQGSGVLASAVAMDKLVSKQLYEKAGIPVPPYLAVKMGDSLDFETCRQRLGTPVVVKPATGGSSIGMATAETAEELALALNAGWAHDDTLLVEAFLDGTEITCGVLGNADPKPLPLIEIIPAATHGFFNYQAKYEAGEAEEICPARISDNLTAKAQSYALTAHQALNCSGYSRTDFILQGDELYILETNTIPGMTATSLFPQAAAAAEIPFSDLLDRLIHYALEEHQRRKRYRPT
ncbi:MAG: D-alanine--D-alanine ligase [Desulfobacterales bacterium]